MLTKEKDQSNLILKIENVSKEYVLGTFSGQTFLETMRQKFSGDSARNRYVALDGVSFEVKKGETVGLIGPNGAGKSTLLKIISRITAPTGGRVCIDGRVASMLEVGTGFHQELTGRENIYLNGSILGMTREEIDRKIDSIIEFSECAEFIDTPVKRYSSGMYVKLAFSIAAHLDSEIMIMDEVLAVGDLKFQTKCLNKMKEIASTEGRTIIYVSHNMDTIHTLCSRCLVLNKGSLIYDGDVDGAVKIYMGAENSTKTSIDYSRVLRPSWLYRDDVRLTWAEYPGKSDNVITGDELEIALRWTANADAEHMGIRFELLDDEKRPFATAVFDDCFTGKAGESGGGIFTIDVHTLMNGRYKATYTLFCANPYHDSIDFDCVSGLDFEISREVADIRWSSSSWGNIRLEPPRFRRDD